MIAIILLGLLQAPAAQETPIEDRIAAFLKGDDAARKELLKLSAYAIRPLQKARDKGPEKIDALVFELKKVAADSRGAGAAESLGRQPWSLELTDATLDTAITALGPLQKLAGLRFYVDPVEPPDPKASKITLKPSTTAREILDQICRQAGLDYGFFHNSIVIGRPDRLWPSGPPAKPPELRGEPLAQAKALVEKLNDDAIEARESAMAELLKLGPSVLPVLEANSKRKEAEIVARCSALIQQLQPRPRGAYGPSGAERQKKTPDEEKALKQIQVMRMSLNFDKSTLEDMVSFLKEFSGIPIELRGDAGKQVYSIQARDQAMFDLLSLITQSRDLDFAIKDGKVVIDTREAIDKMIKEAK